MTRNILRSDFEAAGIRLEMRDDSEYELAAQIARGLATNPDDAGLRRLANIIDNQPGVSLRDRLRAAVPGFITPSQWSDLQVGQAVLNQWDKDQGDPELTRAAEIVYRDSLATIVANPEDFIEVTELIASGDQAALARRLGEAE